MGGLDSSIMRNANGKSQETWLQGSIGEEERKNLVLKLTRKQYTDLFGPTTGDKVRLGDTDLMVQIEKDLITPGDECVFGGGKTLRDGLAQASGVTNSNGALDYLDNKCSDTRSYAWHTERADIGIKDGKIAGIGKAGNPYTMDKVNHEDGCISMCRSYCRRTYHLYCWTLRYAHTHDLSSTIHRRNQQRYL